MAAETCTFTTDTGVKMTMEASYNASFRSSPSILFTTEAGFIDEIRFKTIQDYQSFVKCLLRLDEQL